MKVIYLIAAMLLILQVSYCQTKVDLGGQGRNIDFGNAAATRPIRLVSVVPTSCQLGELIYLTSAPVGKNLYSCTLANVWTLQNTSLDVPPTVGKSGNYLKTDGAQLYWSSPPVGTTTIRTNGNNVATTTALDLSAGSGLIATLSNGAQGVNVNFSLDTAMAATRAYLQSGNGLFCASTGGNASDQRCSLSPNLRTYTPGMLVNWLPQIEGVAGAVSLNINNLGSRRIRLSDGLTDPRQGDLPAGQLQTLWYDGAGFRLQTDKRSVLQNNSYCASSSASSSAYSCNLTPSLQQYSDGLSFYWKPDIQAAAGGISLAVNGLATVPVKFGDGTPTGAVDPRAGDVLAGRVYLLTYDGGVFRIGERQLSVPGGDSYCVASSGTGEVYNCNLSPRLLRMSIGLLITWLPDRNNSGGAATLNVNGLGSFPLKLADGSADPQIGDILANNPVDVFFDGSTFRLNRKTEVNQTSSAVRPTCNSNLRGRLWFSIGGNNVGDELAICAKDSSNVFGWRLLF